MRVRRHTKKSDREIITCAILLPWAGEPVLLERRRAAPLASDMRDTARFCGTDLTSPVAVRLCPGANCMPFSEREVADFGDRNGDKDPIWLFPGTTGSCGPSIVPFSLMEDIWDVSWELGGLWFGLDSCEFPSETRVFPNSIDRLVSLRDDEGTLGKESVKVLADCSSGRRLSTDVSLPRSEDSTYEVFES